MYCIHCGTNLPNHAKFCSKCGSAQPSAATTGGGAARSSPEPGRAATDPRTDPPFLTTQQVADLCQTTKPTVVAAVKAWKVPFSGPTDEMRFLFSDALAFCERLRGERDRQLVVAPQRTSKAKRAGLGLVGIINFVASIVSLITAFASEQFRTAAIVLFVLNGLLFTLGFVRARGKADQDSSAVAGSHRGMAASQTSSSFSWFGAASIVAMIGAAGLAAIAFTDDDAMAVKLSQSSAIPGEEIVVNGEGFPPSSTVRMTFPDESQVDVEVDEDGKFEMSFRVPAVSSGTYPVVVETRAGEVESQSIEISATGEPTATHTIAPTDQPAVTTIVSGDGQTTIPETLQTITATATATPTATQTFTPTPSPTPSPTPTPTPSPTPCDVDGCQDFEPEPDVPGDEPAVDPDSPGNVLDPTSPVSGQDVD